MQVRAARDGDIQAITAIYAAEVRGHVNTCEYEPPDEAEMARRMRELRSAGHPDVPPVLSSTAIWSPIPQSKEIGREEALF